jgi:hypothetical protein
MTRRWGTIGAVTTAVVLAARAIGATDEAHDPDRYKVIIDRTPFCASAGAAAAAQPNFATRFAFVGVVSTTEDNRPLAIIQDKEQNNRIYFKAEGETIDTVKVVKIEQSDQSPSKLVLRQGLEEATLAYQARAGGPSPAPVPGMAQPMPGTVAPATVAPGTFVRTQPATRRIPFRRGGNE